jgi:hypothetical protein
MSENPVFANINYVIYLGIGGFVLILLGSAFSFAFMNTFGYLFVGVALLLVIVGVILEVR